MSMIEYVMAMSLGVSVQSVFALGAGTLMAFSKLKTYYDGLMGDASGGTDGLRPSEGRAQLSR